MTAVELAGRLTGAKPDKGGFTAYCPVHEADGNGHRPSLSIRQSGDKVLLHCHGNCSTDDVLGAIGLHARDLFTDGPTRPTNGTRPAKGATLKLGPIVATYDYADEAGALLYQSCRYAEPEKSFRQRRPDGRDGWIWRLDDVRRVLFGLPELIDRTDVFVVEGEKDALTLRALGLVATTNAGGAGVWRREYADQLVHAGCLRVVVLPDNDEPGQKHGQAVASSCHAAGLGVKVINLPELPHKGDVSDWIAAGATRAALLGIVAEAPAWAPVAAIAFDDPPAVLVPDLTAADIPFDRWSSDQPGRQGGEEPAAPEPTRRRVWSLPEAAALDFPPARWLITNLLPGDGFALIHGDVRVGKSLLLIAQGIAVAAGVPALGCPALTVPEPGAVLYVTEEDPFPRIVERARQIAAGYGLTTLPANFYILPPSGLSLDDTDDQAWLIGEAKARAVRLIILDPIRSLTACADGTSKDLKPFVTFVRLLARHTGAVIALGHHDAKPMAGVQDTRRRGHKASGGGIYSIADCPVHVERQGPDVVLTPHSFKFASDPPRLAIRQTFEPISIRFEVQVDAEHTTDDDGELLDLVLEYVIGHPAQSTTKIRQALGRRQEDVARALIELHNRRQVRCEKRGKAHKWIGEAYSSHLFVPASVPPIGDGTHGRMGDGHPSGTNGTHADERDAYPEADNET